MPSDEDVRAAADELRERVLQATVQAKSELVHRLVEPAGAGSGQHEGENGAGGTPAGQVRQCESSLVALRLAVLAGLDPVGDVINARTNGASWAQIGQACGITRQAAHDRWGQYCQGQ